MKKIILIIFGSVFISACFGQTTRSCDTVYLKTETDIKNVDPCVLVAAEYVLKHPLRETAQAYHDYRAFIMAWMEKTPDYTFSINNKILAICEEDENILLFGVYTTCLAKAAVELKKDFNTEAVKLFVSYVKNPLNGVTQTPKVKKLIEDFDLNKIDKYVK